MSTAESHLVVDGRIRRITNHTAAHRSGVGPTGPPGRDGADDKLTETVAAGENLSGQRVVHKLSGKVFYADKDVPASAKTILGITAGAVAINGDIIVITAGPITEPSWSWSFPGLVFLGNSGQLTQTPPLTGVHVVMGSASSATVMQVRIRDGITLI